MEIKDFDKWYKKLSKSDDEDDFLDFIYDLRKSPYTEYYYLLMTGKNINNHLKTSLWNGFYEHIGAEAFLLDKLDKKLDTEFYDKIIFCLGEIIDINKGKERQKVLEYAKEFINSKNDGVRENAIIVLGWLGGNDEIDLLGNLLLNDTNNKCRAWSSSSFMQISFRKKINTEKVLPYLYNSIKQEKDHFVIESIINTLQEITKKKFGLRQKDMNINNIEAVNKSKVKVLKYFEKMYE